MKKIIKFFLLKLPEWSIFDRLIALAFFLVAHRRLPKRNSGLFNDYLFYLKVSEEIDNPLRQIVSHKDLVKLFYRGIFLEDVAPRTLMSIHSFEDFVAATLPDRCIIKPAHLSGCIYFDKDKSLSDGDIKEIESWYSTNIYYDISRERNYKELQPVVICEELVGDQETIRDYKIFCLNGVPRVIQVDVGRHSLHQRRLYTPDWTALPYRYNKPLAPVENKPNLLDEALKMASVVSKYFSFIRVDCYITPDKVYLGELTNVPENAHGRFENIESEKNFMGLLKGQCV